MKEESPKCAKCPYKISARICNLENGNGLPSCPTNNKQELLQKSLKEYEKPEILEFSRQASIQEGEAYGYKEFGSENVRPIKPRIQEVIEFAKKMKYQCLGLVFCEGLSNEAKIVEKLLTAQGFEVFSPSCKAGRTPKEQIGVQDDQKVCHGCFESMCNPIFQAFLLNDKKVEFNILLGLCVGHDSLFSKYAEAFCTTLATKDRLLGHNPLAAIYNIDSYYGYLRLQGD